MGEQLGLLKVTVVQGKRLVIRDFKSSDPYVIVKLGNQTAKTKVINSCLNPVWNEELSFSLTEPVGVLNLSVVSIVSPAIPLGSLPPVYCILDYHFQPANDKEVFDRDHFKADDKMGRAHLSLQPLVTASRMRQILQVSSGETTLRKVIPDTDNCLVRESSINCINGEVVQNVWLRLGEVESGELELMIKLLNHSTSPLK